MGDELIQLVVILPSGNRVVVEEEDTTRLFAYGLTKSGDSVAPDVIWEELTPSQFILLEATSGEIVGQAAGTTSVQARSGSLRSDVIGVDVLAAADTIEAAGATVDTVAAASTISQPLLVLLKAFTDADTTLLVGRSVTFSIVDPVDPAVDFTTAPDTINISVDTDDQGLASTTLSRRAGVVTPDSVVIEVSASRATGLIVPGTPVRFVVYFE